MQAIILAAGVGSRLKSVTGGVSKALIEIGGRPLIHHQLEALADHGIGPVLVVLGYQAEDVAKAIGNRAETIVNERYAETNSVYSLWLAREWVQGPFILLNCDLLFDPRILDRLLATPGNALVYDSTSSRGREQTKVAIKRGRVMDIGKDLPPASARGESLGLLKFDADGGRALLDTADHLVRDGVVDAWVIEATRGICSQVELHGTNVAGEAWTEIDFPYDLDVARRDVWPVIWKGRWRRQVYWRRTRWLLAGSIALALVLGGWVANSRVGPASVDWETLSVAGTPSTRLLRADGSQQRWWIVSPDSVLTIPVGGPLVRIETRLLMPPDTSAKALRYVVGVTVDGEEHEWRALRAEPDSATRSDSGVVGARNRIRLTLPPGEHVLGVRLVAAEGGTLLVRVRQADAVEEDDG